MGLIIVFVTLSKEWGKRSVSLYHGNRISCKEHDGAAGEQAVI